MILTDESIYFLPKWSVVFAPIGLVFLWFGVDYLHDRNRERVGAALWIGGAILWAYGLSAILGRFI